MFSIYSSVGMVTIATRRLAELCLKHCKTSSSNIIFEEEVAETPFYEALKKHGWESTGLSDR